MVGKFTIQLISQFVLLVMTLHSSGSSACVGATAQRTQDTESSDSVVDSDSDERIRAIVLQHKAARADILSYSMRIAWERRSFPISPVDAPLPTGALLSYGEGVWMEKGQKWRVQCLKRWENEANAPTGSPPPGKPWVSREYSTWTVYNGDHFAKHSSKLPGRIQFYPRDTIEAKLVLPEGELFPFPLTWGFGFGGGYLDEEYEKSRSFESTRWESEDLETDNGPKIKLIRINPGKRRDRDQRTEFTIDPARSFLLVRVEHYMPPDVLQERRVFELQQLPDGRWYPARATVRDPTVIDTYTFTNVGLNPKIDDEKFSVEAFGLDLTKARLRRKELDGSGTNMLFRDGQWIPESIVPEHLRPTLPGDGELFKDRGTNRKR